MKKVDATFVVAGSEVSFGGPGSRESQ
jgi:hypothetical protein